MDVIEQAVVEFGLRRHDEIALAPAQRQTQAQHRRRGRLAVIEANRRYRTGIVVDDDAQHGEAVEGQAAQPADAPRLARHQAVEAGAEAVDEVAAAAARGTRPTSTRPGPTAGSGRRHQSSVRPRPLT